MAKHEATLNGEGMIIIKYIKDGEVTNHMEFNKKIRASRHAIIGCKS